ncbi:hypothetical protein INT45_012009 [Circinella minor]|uniref:RalA-binding protein 1 n=1 Tax=Circinella minor TaxID=1195481 RepID=A0A8H7SG67_9FUNG|nr:hypothetical protein INT45_012009 [Circinella minor]
MMSQDTAPPQPPNNHSNFPTGNELGHLRSQNEQLWKIIEKQRVMIQNLQKDNARLAIERDGVMDKFQQLEKQMGLKKQRQRAASILISPEVLREIAEADDAAAATTPTPSETSSPIELPVPTIITTNLSSPTSSNNNNGGGGGGGAISPVPPPRSPFRSVKPVDGSPPASPLPMDKAARRARARESMMPPPRSGIPEYDPTMRAASPPLPRMPHRHSIYHAASVPPPSATISLNRPFDLTPSSSEDNTPPPPLPVFQQQQLQGFHGNNNTIQEPLALGDVSIKVVGSNIKTNERGKEVIAFLIGINRKAAEGHNELWRVEKFYSDFLDLDTKLKTQPNPAVTSKISKLPDKALFTTHAPSKVDIRKAALEHYLQHAVSLPWDDMADLCEFLSTNVIEHAVPAQAIGKKEGYLTKRGKNFGGWKSRYFVLNEDVINYYESKDTTQLGTIRLTNAQIGRQTSGVTPAADESNSIYRHAFLLVEQKRAGSSHLVRHILCADSDKDRDEWVEAIIQNIRFDDESPGELINKRNKKEKPRKTSKGDIPPTTLRAPSPVPGDVGVAISSGVGPTPSVSSDSTDSSLLSSSLPSSSAGGIWPPPPPNAQEIGRASLDQLPQHGRNLHTPPPILLRRSSMTNIADENQQQQQQLPPQRAPSPSGRHSEDLLDDGSEKKAKNKANRMTFWPKKMFGSSDAAPTPKPSTSLTTDSSSSTSTSNNSNNTSNAPRASIAPTGFRSFLSRSSNESSDPKRGGGGGNAGNAEVFGPNQVFSVPLEDAVRVSKVVEGYELPSVVYRCIEYLDAKNAVLEEGLYRLSGSSTVMKNLRHKFNKDGDVNLLTAKEYYDVHAVAGLLKMWLRELPTSVLTRELRTDFLHVIDLLDRKDRVNELGRLVSQLPLANYTLLRALTAHLIRVVQHSDVNKMTVRNVSIVFSPTLGIPAMIFNLFMSEFEYVFWTTEDGDAAPRRIEDEPSSEEQQQEQGNPVYQPAETISVTQHYQEQEQSLPSSSSEQTQSYPSGDAEQQQQQQQQQQPALGRKPTLKLREEFGRNNRNSVNYFESAPNAIVELERNMDGPPVLDEDEDDEDFNELTLTSAPRISEEDTYSTKIPLDISIQQQPSVTTTASN